MQPKNATEDATTKKQKLLPLLTKPEAKYNIIASITTNWFYKQQTRIFLPFSKSDRNTYCLNLAL